MSDMMPAAAGNYSGTPDKEIIPAKVAAAQEYLRFADGLRHPPPSFDGHRQSERELTPKEQAVYDAALEVLRLYFMGEQDYAPAGRGSGSRGDDDPKSREPVSA